MSTSSDIELIKNDLSYLRKFIEEDRQKFDLHIEESKVYRSKVDSFNNTDRELKEHIIADRWFFGLLITMLIGIFIKLFMP